MDTLTTLDLGPPGPRPDPRGLADAYGWASVARVTELGGGASRDAVLRVSATDAGGRPLEAVVKVLHPMTSAGTGHLEQQLAAEMRALAAGVSMPELLVTAGGAPWAVIRVGPGRRRVVAHRFVESTPVEYAEEEALRSPAALEVARSLARLHRLEGASRPELVHWQSDAVAADRWEQLADALGGVSSRAALRLRSEMPRLARAAAILGAGGRPDVIRLTHNDCAPHNAIRPRRGQPPVMLVDWESISGGSPRQELAGAVVRWADVGPGGERLMAAMVRSYRAAGGMVEFTDITDFIPYLGSMLHWLENRIEIASGLAVDERTPPVEALASVYSMLAWLPEIDRLEGLHRILRAA